jgi:fumarate reductase subunit D
MGTVRCWRDLNVICFSGPDFAAGWLGKTTLFLIIFLSLWHAAHRLRVVFHDFGVRMDAEVATGVYLVATIGTILTAIYLGMVG